MTASIDEPVRTLIQRPAVHVHLDDPLRHVARTLSTEGVGAAIVKGTHPPALVSERDVIDAIANGANLDRTRARDVMTEDLAVASPSDGIRDVTSKMLHNDVRHIPVIEDDVVIGVVSVRDALRAFAERLEAARAGGA